MSELGKRKMNFLPSLAHLKLHEAAPIEGKRGADGEQAVPKAPLAIHPNRHIVLYTGVNSDEQEEAMRNFLRAIADEVDSPAGEEEYVINSEKMGIYVGKGLEPGDIDEVSSFPEMIRRFQLYLDGTVPADFRSSMLGQVYAGENLYGYLADDTRPALPLLKSSANVLVERSYQTNVMERFFPMEGMARSGIGVVPCGAGKTAIGILATLRMGRSTIVFCPDKLSVEQWYNEFKKWTQIPAASASRIQKWAENEDNNPDPKNLVVLSDDVPTVLITTYSLIAGKNTSTTRDAIGKHNFGLAVLDEVHKVATTTAMEAILQRTKSMCKIGLTGTFIREDVAELGFILQAVGPIVVNVSLSSLQAGGHIAKVNIVRYDIPLPKRWKRAYDAETDGTRKTRILALNQATIKGCMNLFTYHEKMGHSILVFVEEVKILEEYARILDRDYIDGTVASKNGGADANKLIKDFRDGKIKTLLFSKKGDNSIDIPNADVIIEISRIGISGVQVGQRVGRVQRAKCGFNEGIFYMIYPSNSASEKNVVDRRCDYLATMGYDITETTEPLKPQIDAYMSALQAGRTGDPDYTNFEDVRNVNSSLLSSSEDKAALFEWVTDGSRPVAVFPVLWRSPNRQINARGEEVNMDGSLKRK